MTLARAHNQDTVPYRFLLVHPLSSLCCHFGLRQAYWYLFPFTEDRKWECLGCWGSWRSHGTCSRGPSGLHTLGLEVLWVGWC